MSFFKIFKQLTKPRPKPKAKPRPLPLSTKRAVSGVFWRQSDAPALAASRNIDIKVIQFDGAQAILCDAAGGRSQYGAKVLIAARLQVAEGRVQVSILGKPVGYVDDSPLYDELLAADPSNLGTTCKAKIVGGWTHNLADIRADIREDREALRDLEEELSELVDGDDEEDAIELAKLQSERNSLKEDIARSQDRKNNAEGSFGLRLSLSRPLKLAK